MTIRIIDTETTGVDPKVDRVCEIASVDLGRDGTLTGRRNHLVNPGRPIPPEVSAITHIIDADVQDKPRLEELIIGYRGASLYVAHNAAFDKGFLDKPGLIQGAKWFCTFKAALRIWPDAPSHSNQALRYMLGFVDPLGVKRSEIDPHRALSDVIVTAALFHVLTTRAKWSDMLAWQAEPPLRSRITFGKHKGQRLSEVPIDYLDWMKRSDLDEEWKFSADHWISKRRAA